MTLSFLIRRGVLVWTLIAAGARAAEPAPAAKTPEELRSQLAALVTQERFDRALWSVKVVSLDTGRTVFDFYADRLMAPASNCKLYTAALALDVLGRDYRLVTPIYATAKPDATGELRGDVIVSGRGDPSWKTRGTDGKFLDNFEPFVIALEKAGVRRIAGDLVADATWLRAWPQGTGWMTDDLNESYGAEISAITLEDNFADVRVTPGTDPGQPCDAALMQPHTGLTLDNRATTAPAGAKRTITAQRVVDETVVHVFGELPAGGKEEIVHVAVPRPAAWFAESLKEALARRGIRLDGRAYAVRWPDPSPLASGEVLLGEIRSPPLRELVAGFLKPSQNLETDLIFDHLGEARRPAGTPATRTAEECAADMLRDFLVQHSLPLDEVRIVEGSGLSQYNLASANATVSLLQFMTTHRAAKDFYDALPIAGVDGTLRNRMRGTPAAGNLHAKTGTLRWASSLSGYVTTAAGEKLAFSLMLNRNTPPPERSSTADLDEIAVALARFAGRSAAPAK